MRVESVESCKPCVFLREPESPKAYCMRMGSSIEKTNTCLTGRLIKFPESLDEWRNLIQQGKLAIQIAWESSTK